MLDAFGAATGTGPQHGYRGEREPSPSGGWPRGLTIALSRESGARGGSIAKRVGRKLGWQVFDQEQLEFLSQAEGSTHGMPEAARTWADERLDVLLRAKLVSRDPAVVQLTRVILALGASGEAILIGRGAGHILPPACTLHVRIVAPMADRIAYLSQWLRLPEPAAAEELRRRDAGRAEFLLKHLNARADDVQPYDLVLNSGRLGEQICSELIAEAARAKLQTLDLGGAEDE